MNKSLSFFSVVLIAILFTACAHFTFNASICDRIASDPHATMPEECRIYNEEEADIAFYNLNNKPMESNVTIEFTNEK